MSIVFPETVCDLKEFKKIISTVRNIEAGRQFYEGNHVKAFFRGQNCKEWELKPKILRYNKTVDELNVIQGKIVDDFVSEMKQAGLYSHLQEGFLRYEYHTEWLFHEQAQHLGLATRFMDWTLEPYIGLFFSCCGNRDKDGRFFILFPELESFVCDNSRDVYGNTHPHEFRESICLNPSQFADPEHMKKIAERFKRRQHGRFFIQPIDIALISLG